MHSMAASAAMRAAESGLIGSISSSRVLDGANTPFARCHFSKNGCMSVARSLKTGRFSSGPISSRPPWATFATWVRQVQRGRPLTDMAQNIGHDVEHGLARAQWNPVGLVATLFAAPPERYGQLGGRVGHELLGPHMIASLVIAEEV